MAAAAPTGCFKCGRPGHWSRDCPSAPASTAGGPDSAAATNSPKPAAARFGSSYPSSRPAPAAAAEGDGGSGSAQGAGKKKKERKTRPKLTPDLLLSDDGLGFVLRYFPKAFRPRGRPGHEVEDLGNLIKLYTDWHSRLIPYYSFEQFVRKAEQVGATNRVRRCISELRERVARGGDPAKLHESLGEEATPTGEPDGTAPDEDPIFGTEAPLPDNEVMDSIREDEDLPMDSIQEVEGLPVDSNDLDPMQEDLLNEIYEKAADEPQIPGGEASQPSAPKEATPRDDDPLSSKVQRPQDGGAGASQAKVELTEEQKARMEANRLKALERAAAARARASQQPTQ